MGTGSPIWTGIGAPGRAIAGMLWRGASRDIRKLVSPVMVLAGAIASRRHGPARPLGQYLRPRWGPTPLLGETESGRGWRRQADRPALAPAAFATRCRVMV